jgi:hypothetical protein
MVKSDTEEIDIEELEKSLSLALSTVDGLDDPEVDAVGGKQKDKIVNEAVSASEAVEEGFGNINQMIYERLDINRACLMVLMVLVLILIFKEDIMKSSFVKNLLK